MIEIVIVRRVCGEKFTPDKSGSVVLKVFLKT